MLTEEMKLCISQMDDLALREDGDCISKQEFVKLFTKVKSQILISSNEFCLIQRRDKKAGFASYIVTNLQGIYQSLQNNKIPVIDMDEGETPFSKEKGGGKTDGRIFSYSHLGFP